MKKTDGKKRFPKRELNTWLRTHLSWDHQQWLTLIEELSTEGFQDWTEDQSGIDAIGLYLETKKASA